MLREPSGESHAAAIDESLAAVSPSKRHATVSVIIVSFNTRQTTLDCLAALFAGLGETSAEVIVVDNASVDGSVEAIRAAFPKVDVIASDRNLGFGAANNLAMKRSVGRYILLLNSDAFIRPGAISSLVAYLDSHADVGVVGPRLLNADGTLQKSCYPFPTPGRGWIENLWISALFPNHPRLGDYRQWAHDTERDVAWVIGACMLVRREVFDRVGGFDERFFMYSEEADWQWRIRLAGWKVAFTPSAVVVHLGGASGATDKARIHRHFFTSLDYYQRKHHGLAGLILFRAAMVVGGMLRLVAWSGVFLLQPRRREVARTKVKLLSWLCVRQSTSWRLSF
jgi:GT2 family glycosyltransferase